MPAPQRRFSFESILEHYAAAAEESGEALPTYESLIHPAFRNQVEYIDEKMLPAPLKLRTSGPGFPPPRTVDLPIELESELYLQQPQYTTASSSRHPSTSYQPQAQQEHPTSSFAASLQTPTFSHRTVPTPVFQRFSAHDALYAHPGTPWTPPHLQEEDDDDIAVPGVDAQSLPIPIGISNRPSYETMDSYKIPVEPAESDTSSEGRSSWRSNTFSSSSSRASTNTEKSQKIAQLSAEFGQGRKVHTSSKAMSVLGILPQQVKSSSHSRESSMSSLSQSVYSSSPESIKSKRPMTMSAAVGKAKASHRVGRTNYVGCEKALMVLGITEEGEPRPSSSSASTTSLDLATPVPTSSRHAHNRLSKMMIR